MNDFGNFGMKAIQNMRFPQWNSLHISFPHEWHQSALLPPVVVTYFKTLLYTLDREQVLRWIPPHSEVLPVARPLIKMVMIWRSLLPVVMVVMCNERQITPLIPALLSYENVRQVFDNHEKRFFGAPMGRQRLTHIGTSLLVHSQKILCCHRITLHQVFILYIQQSYLCIVTIQMIVHDGDIELKSSRVYPSFH